MADVDTLTAALRAIHTMVQGPYNSLNASHTAEEQATLDLLYNVLVICENTLNN